MSQHTKGPWPSDGSNIGIDSTGRVIAFVNSSNSIEEREANALLIRHAPEMFEALELILNDDRRMNALSSIQARAVMDVVAKVKGERK